MGKWIILIIALFAIFFFVLRRKHSPAMALHISAIPPPNKDAADFSSWRCRVQSNCRREPRRAFF